MPTSRDSLLRLLRGLPDVPVRSVPVLGVDDFALRTGPRHLDIVLRPHRVPFVLGAGLVAVAVAARVSQFGAALVRGPRGHAGDVRFVDLGA